MRLEFAGPLTLAEVGRWREALLDAIARGGPLRIDLGASGPWDAAGLQLLLCAEESCRRAGLDLTFEALPGALRALAEAAGVAFPVAGDAGD